MQGTLHLIAPSAPPKTCGVGDHSYHLALALSKRTRLEVHCGQESPAPQFGTLDARTDFDHRHPRTLKRLSRSEEFRPGDTAFVQYTNFAYGRYGFNPWMAPALANLRRRRVRVATMFHETYMSASEGWKAAIMGRWQRRFFRQIGLNSDVCLFSTEPWAGKYADWFPASTVACLPVGSNIPVAGAQRSIERSRLGIPDGAVGLVVFGGAHPSRLFPWIAQASRNLVAKGIEHRLVHIGPDSERVADLLEGCPLLELGIQSEDGVSRAFAAGDLLLAPFSDGASTRRTSLLSGLEHGLCCVTTRGPGTDSTLSAQGGSSLVFALDGDDFEHVVLDLASDHARARGLGAAAKIFHRENYSWESIADRCLELVGGPA